MQRDICVSFHWKGRVELQPSQEEQTGEQKNSELMYIPGLWYGVTKPWGVRFGPERRLLLDHRHEGADRWLGALEDTSGASRSSMGWEGPWRPLCVGSGVLWLAACHESRREEPWSGGVQGMRSQTRTSCQTCLEKGQRNSRWFSVSGHWQQRTQEAWC